MAEKGKSAEISYSGARSLVTFSRGEQGMCFMFDYDTKEKEHKNTRQSDLRPLVQIR
jgi:Zn/Cd-binding protein ZinT